MRAFARGAKDATRGLVSLHFPLAWRVLDVVLLALVKTQAYMLPFSVHAPILTSHLVHLLPHLRLPRLHLIPPLQRVNVPVVPPLRDDSKLRGKAPDEEGGHDGYGGAGGDVSAHYEAGFGHEVLG